MAADGLGRSYDRDEIIKIAKEHYESIIGRSNVSEDEVLKSVKDLLTWKKWSMKKINQNVQSAEEY